MVLMHKQQLTSRHGLRHMIAKSQGRVSGEYSRMANNVSISFCVQNEAYKIYIFEVSEITEGESYDNSTILLEEAAWRKQSSPQGSLTDSCVLK